MAASPIFLRRVLVMKGLGVSSTSFWWRRWMEQSRSLMWQKVPYWSPAIWISMWRGSSMNFSMYMPGLPNAAPASWLAFSKASSNSSSFHTRRMPLPPPPAVAFRITG